LENSELEKGNIQEKSELGAGTPNEFPRYPDNSGLGQENILEKSGL